MKNLKNYIFSGLVILAFLFTSCIKEEDIKVDQELLAANAQIDFGNELDFDAGVDVANENSSYSDRNGTNFQSIYATCADVSVDNPNIGEFPKTFTVDFGKDVYIMEFFALE